MSSIDFNLLTGVGSIPIEERSGEEISLVHGISATKGPTSVRICEDGTNTQNFAFDVTPAELVTGIITERGVCEATEASLRTLID